MGWRVARIRMPSSSVSCCKTFTFASQTTMTSANPPSRFKSALLALAIWSPTSAPISRELGLEQFQMLIIGFYNVLGGHQQFPFQENGLTETAGDVIFG